MSTVAELKLVTIYSTAEYFLNADFLVQFVMSFPGTECCSGNSASDGVFTHHPSSFSRVVAHDMCQHCPNKPLDGMLLIVPSVYRVVYKLFLTPQIYFFPDRITTSQLYGFHRSTTCI